MKHCPYCYAFQEQWNLIVASMEAKYNDGDYKQVVFLQADKDELSYLLRKYGVRSFPTFVYVKPGTNGKTANRFQENRSYESLKKWMEKEVILHGGEVLNEEEEDPVFLNKASDDDLAMEEDDEISEMIKRMKAAHIKLPKNV